MKYVLLSIILLSSCTGAGKYDNPGVFEPREETVRILGCEQLKERNPQEADC